MSKKKHNDYLAVQITGTPKTYRITKNGILIAFAHKFPDTDSEQFPFLIFKAIVGQGQPLFGEMVYDTYDTPNVLTAARKADELGLLS